MLFGIEMNVISLNTLILNTLLVIYKSRCYSNLLFTSLTILQYIFFQFNFRLAFSTTKSIEPTLTRNSAVRLSGKTIFRFEIGFTATRESLLSEAALLSPSSPLPGQSCQSTIGKFKKKVLLQQFRYELIRSLSSQLKNGPVQYSNCCTVGIKNWDQSGF